MSSRSATGYHLQCTGAALETARAHSAEKHSNPSIRLMGACFCPFVQRAWIALELLNQAAGGGEATKKSRVDYEYYEEDPYKKSQALLKVSPKGLVPAIILPGDKALNDSLIILHYLSSLPLSSSAPNPLLPADAYTRALHLLAGQKHTEAITPAFYRFLQAQEPEKQVEYGKALTEVWEEFEKDMVSVEEGLYFHGKELGWVDILIAPWAIRIEPVLHHYRSYSPPFLTDNSRRFHKWLKAIEAHPAVSATTSTDELYVDSYHRYAANLPMTSQVADAINNGTAMP